MFFAFDNSRVSSTKYQFLHVFEAITTDESQVTNVRLLQEAKYSRSRNRIEVPALHVSVWNKLQSFEAPFPYPKLCLSGREVRRVSGRSNGQEVNE